MMSSWLWKILQIDIMNILNNIKKEKMNSFDTSKENEILFKELINEATSKSFNKKDLTYDEACNILFKKLFVNRINQFKLLNEKKLKANNFEEFLEIIEEVYSDIDSVIIKQLIKEEDFNSLNSWLSNTSLETALYLFEENKELIWRRIRYLVTEKQALKSLNSESYDPSRIMTNLLYKANLSATASNSQKWNIDKVFNKEMKQKVVLSDLNDSVYSALKDISKYIVTEPVIDKVEIQVEKPSKIVMVNMCDIHLNEGFVYKNRPEMSWTPEICVSTFNKVLDHVTKLKERYNIVEIKIAMLGDMIWTWIHQELAENLALGPNTSERIFSILTAQFFTYLNKYIAPTELITVPWNHSERRVWHEKRDTFWENNSDSMTMQEIYVLFKDLEIDNGICFPRDQDFAVYKKIWEKVYMFSHGDRRHGESTSYWDSEFHWDKLDYSVIWHLHHPEIKKLWRVTEYILPTLKKPDPYTKNNWWDTTFETISSVLIIDPVSWKIEKMENFVLDNYEDIGYVKFNFDNLTEEEIVDIKKIIRRENWIQIIKKDSKPVELYNKLKLNVYTTQSFSSILEKITECKDSIVRVPLFKDKLFKDLKEAYNDNKANRDLTLMLDKISNETKSNYIEFIREKWKYKLNLKISSDKVFIYNETLDGVLLLDKTKNKYVFDTDWQILYKLKEEDWKLKKIKVDLKGEKAEDYIAENKLQYAKFDIMKLNNKTYSSFKDLEENRQLISIALKWIYKRFLLEYPRIFLEEFEEEIQELNLQNLLL